MPQISIRNALASLGFIAIGFAMWVTFPHQLANLLSFPLFFFACTLALVSATSGAGDVRAFGIGALPPLLAMLICIASFLPGYPLSADSYVKYRPSIGTESSPYLFRQILLILGMAGCCGFVGVLATRIVHGNRTQDDD